MKGKQKQHSIFIEIGKSLAVAKPYARKQAHSFFQNTPTPSSTSNAMPLSIGKNTVPCRRKVSLPIQPKKVQTGLLVGMNDGFLHTRKESYLNSQFNMRKNRLRVISKENNQIYNRINSQKSVYSSQDLNKSFESNAVKKRLSESKLSQRSNSSRNSIHSNNSNNSSRSKVSLQREQKAKQLKKDFHIEIKTTNIMKLPIKELSGFKGMFSVGNSRASSEHGRQRDRNLTSISSFRKNDSEQQPRKEEVRKRTLELVKESDKNPAKGMGGLLHRIA